MTQYNVLGDNPLTVLVNGTESVSQDEMAVKVAKLQFAFPFKITSESSLSMPAKAGQLMLSKLMIAVPPIELVVKLYQSTFPVPAQNGGEPLAPVLSPAKGCCAHSVAADMQSMLLA